MIVVVDRIEGQFAVVELPDRTTMDVPLMELPDGTKPSDCLEYVGGKYLFKLQETQRRKNEIKKLMDSMWND